MNLTVSETDVQIGEPRMTVRNPASVRGTMPQVDRISAMERRLKMLEDAVFPTYRRRHWWRRFIYWLRTVWD